MSQSSSGGQKGRPNRNRRRSRGGQNRGKSGGNNPKSQSKSQGSGKRNNNRNRNRNRNNNRNRNRNRSQNRNRKRSSSKRTPEKKPSLGRRILSIVTFGLVPATPTAKKKPAAKKSAAAPVPKAPPARKKVSRAQLAEITSTRLHVENLAYDATERNLNDLFKGVGVVLSTEVVTNPETQQSKGYAFVEMSHIDEAKRAFEILHGEDFMGRKLAISAADSDGPRVVTTPAPSSGEDDESAAA